MNKLKTLYCLDKTNIITCFSFTAVSPAEGVYGGHNTTIKRHSWQLSLQNDDGHFCGAALIAPQWALTSGQCALKYFDLYVRAGSNYTTTGGELYEVDKIFVHPEFNEETMDSDLALLKFTENVTVNNVLTADLPRATDSISENSPAYVTGWGSTTSESPDGLSDELQFAQIPTRTLTQCRTNYTGKLITENMLCFGYDRGNIHLSSCEGDYGGPVVVKARLVGIQSWGQGCGDGMHPSIFTVVSHFVSWINTTMNTN